MSDILFASFLKLSFLYIRAHGTAVNMICEDIREGLIAIWALEAGAPGTECMWFYGAVTTDAMDEELDVVCTCGGLDFPAPKIPRVDTDGIVFSACPGRIISIA